MNCREELRPPHDRLRFHCDLILSLQDIQHWESLKSNVINIDLIVDKLVFKDIQLTATNDDQYFVFEDILYQVNLAFNSRTKHSSYRKCYRHQVMLSFSRDTEISDMVQNEFTNSAKSKQYEVPPSGIVPFHGICMFGKV